MCLSAAKANVQFDLSGEKSRPPFLWALELYFDTKNFMPAPDGICASTVLEIFSRVYSSREPGMSDLCKSISLLAWITDSAREQGTVNFT